MAQSPVQEEDGTSDFTLEAEGGILLLEEATLTRRAQVSWVEFEVPAQRCARVSWAELEVPVATRRAQVSWVELTVNDAPRMAQMSWVEFKVPDVQTTSFYILQEDDTQGKIAKELNDGFLATEEGVLSRRTRVAWAELEVPLAPRRARVSWAEHNVPAYPETWYILAELPTDYVNTYFQKEDAAGRYLLEEWIPQRRAQVGWVELEIPAAERAARVSWAEISVPVYPETYYLITETSTDYVNTYFQKEDVSGRYLLEEWAAPRRAQVGWVELEVPGTERKTQVSWAELEVPVAPRRAQVSFAELEVPLGPRRAQVSWTEFEVPILAKRAQVSWVEFQVPPPNSRRAQVSWAEFAVGVKPGRSIQEQFTAGMGTILGVQATIQADIDTLEIVDMHIDQINTSPERAGRVLLNIDGVLYFVEFRFTEETFDQRTQEGYTKVRNPKARSR